MRGKCPFLKGKECREDCVFYRRGMRYFDDGREPQPFEECALNILTDGIENLIVRSIGQQQAIESMRNQIAELKELISIQMEQQKKLIGGLAFYALENKTRKE